MLDTLDEKVNNTVTHRDNLSLINNKYLPNNKIHIICLTLNLRRISNIHTTIRIFKLLFKK